MNKKKYHLAYVCYMCELIYHIEFITEAVFSRMMELVGCANAIEQVRSGQDHPDYETDHDTIYCKHSTCGCTTASDNITKPEIKWRDIK